MKAEYEEIADRLRNSDCCHNVPGFTVPCAADCNRCITAAIQSAVEEATANMVKADSAARVMDTAIDLAVEAELRRMIPLVCVHCAADRLPEKTGFSHWEHRIMGYKHVCPASPLHEALHKETDSAEQVP